MNDKKYRMPEMTVPNYVSLNKVKQMIYNKYKKGEITKGVGEVGRGCLKCI
jgi:hypothetical protein